MSDQFIDSSQSIYDWCEWIWDAPGNRYFRTRVTGIEASGEEIYEYDFSHASSSSTVPRDTSGGSYGGRHSTTTDYYQQDGYTSNNVNELADTLATTRLSESGRPLANQVASYDRSSAGPREDEHEGLRAIPTANVPSRDANSRGFSMSAPAAPSYSYMSAARSNYQDFNRYLQPWARPSGFDSNFGASSSRADDAKHSDVSTTIPRMGKSIEGTSRSEGRLDSRYKVQHTSVFKPSGVFMTPWMEPIGTTESKQSAISKFPMGKDTNGKDVYISIRRFVIVTTGHGFSNCVPITTYGRQGMRKQGAKPDEHSVIYIGDKPPKLLRGEPELSRPPIRVTPKNPRDKLSPESRVNYAKIYTVEHNVKVLFIGHIAKDYQGKFMLHFDEVWSKQRGMPYD